MLKEHGVDFSGIELVRRAWRRDYRDISDDGFPVSILVWARRDQLDSNEGWCAACADLSSYLASNTNEGIAVEIAEPETASVTESSYRTAVNSIYRIQGLNCFFNTRNKQVHRKELPLIVTRYSEVTLVLAKLQSSSMKFALN